MKPDGRPNSANVSGFRTLADVTAWLCRAPTGTLLPASELAELLAAFVDAEPEPQAPEPSAPGEPATTTEPTATAESESSAEPPEPRVNVAPVAPAERERAEAPAPRPKPPISTTPPKDERPAPEPRAEAPVKPPPQEKPEADEPEDAEPKTSAPPFDTGAAKAALAQAASLAGSCGSSGGPTGIGKVQVTFRPSGRVSTATVVSGPFGGTTVGSCVARTFRRARVPEFSGSPVTVAKSFSIQ